MPAVPVLILIALVGRAQAGSDALERARTLLDAGATEQALQVLEAAVAARPDDPALQRAHARALERLVDAGGPWLAMSDARGAWDRALALAPDDLETRCGAIAVRLRLGEHDAALALAERALGAAWLDGGTAPPALLELACRARLGALPVTGAAPEPGVAPHERAAAVARAWAALEHARALAPGSAELVRLAAGLLDAEGLAARAAEELIAAIARAPAAAELHRALIDLHVREGIEERLSALYESWSGAGTNATLAWFTGYACRLGADVAQRERRCAEALAGYERAGEWMGVAATLEPSFRATAETIRFQTQVSAAWCELDSGSDDALERASARLLALLRAELARRDEPDGLGRTLMHALSALGERRVARSDFARAAEEARAVVTLLPDEGAWWNNLGFLLREHATQLAAGGAAPDESEARARETFQESWRAYQRAAELLPDDPRVINDAALVQVYHLRDNLAAAETMLERAIDLGEEQLAALGPAPDERARFPLAQALGDAYLNLGYLHYHVYRQSARARAAFERALATDSGERPDVVEYIAAIDGQRGPVSEPDRTAFVAPAPREPASRRTAPAWEASLAEARALAAAEGHALLLYHRGDGLGLAAPALDELVTSAEFARATQGLVLLVSDAERRTFVDRRRDGRRVACPRFGTVTCGEHQRVDAEVRAWFTELHGEVPGESEEGLWLLAPGADEPERLRDLARLSELAPATRTLDGEPFEALEASLGGEDGGGEARTLVSTRSLAARLAVERILWDGFRSSPARGFLLAALAEDGTSASSELLAACVHQDADHELARAALDVWPTGLELAPVVHVWRWSQDAETRAAAERVIARERPADPLLRASVPFVR